MGLDFFYKGGWKQFALKILHIHVYIFFLAKTSRFNALEEIFSLKKKQNLLMRAKHTILLTRIMKEIKARLS